MRLPFNKPDKPVSTKFGLSQPGSCNASLLFRSLPAAFACEVPGASQDQGAPSRRHEDCREVAAQVDLDPRGPVVRPARARRVRRARRARRAAKAVKGQGVGGERKWWEGLKRPHGSTQVQGVRFFHQWVTNDVHLYLYTHYFLYIRLISWDLRTKSAWSCALPHPRPARSFSVGLCDVLFSVLGLVQSGGRVGRTSGTWFLAVGQWCKRSES